MRITLLIPFVMLSICCAGQQRELDSLLGLLKRYTREDSTRLKLLNDIAYEYSRVEPARGLATADEAIMLAKKLQEPRLLASALNYKAMNYGGLGEDSESLRYYRQALAIHEQVSDRLRMASTYNNIAIALVNLSDYPAALEYHEKAYTIFQQLGDKGRMGNSLNNRGVIYLYLADYNQALKYHLQALSIFEQLNNDQSKANTLTNIGLVYDHLSDFRKAVEYQNRALELNRSSGNRHGVAGSLGNLGNVYHNMGENDEALKYYLEALEISRALGDRRGIASNYANIGIVYSSIADYPKAFGYLQQSIVLNRQSGDKKRISGDLLEMGRIMLNAPEEFLSSQGIESSERHNTVSDYVNKSLALSREIGSTDLQRDAWEILASSHEKNRRYDLALHAHRQYVVLRDSIMNAELKQDITRKEMQFEYEKKEVLAKAEHEKKQAESEEVIERQRVVKNIMTGFAAVVLVAGMTSFAFYKRKRDAEEKRKDAEFRLRQAKTEMEIFRLQMNPHFIFNSLNSINDYIERHDTGSATLYTTRFARLMRMILENSRKQEISLEDDLYTLELYLQLERMRLDQRFDFEIRKDPQIEAGNTMVPPMLLQPFVENSIWHGLSEMKDGGKIYIDVILRNDMIEYAVQDNGVGRKTPGYSLAIQDDGVESMYYAGRPAGKEALVGRKDATTGVKRVKEVGATEKHDHEMKPLVNGAGPARGNIKKSLGMKITSERIEKLNGLGRPDASLRVRDLENGLRVELLLPLVPYC